MVKGRLGNTNKFIKSLDNYSCLEHLEIIGEYINSYTKILVRCKHCNVEWMTLPQHIKTNTHGCRKCYYDSKAHSHYDYLNKLNNKESNTIYPIEFYRRDNIKILHKCNVCSYEWYVSPNSVLKKSYRCVSCFINYNNSVIAGKNDINTTHPFIASFLVDPADGDKFSAGSEKTALFKCKYCNSVQERKICDVVKSGYIRCCFCSGGVSFPERFFSNILKSNNIIFKHDVRTPWSKLKRYDFIIEDYSLIVETHGIQHYQDQTGMFASNGHTLDVNKTNDKFKKELALKNGFINYFELDCRKSDLSYMKNSIIDSGVLYILGLTEYDIDWANCYKNSFDSIIFEAANLWNNGNNSINDIANKINVHYITVIQYLKKASKTGLSDYSPKTAVSKDKTIHAVNDNLYFDSIADANRYYGFNASISNCLLGRQKSAGKHPCTNEPLKWEYGE